MTENLLKLDFLSVAQTGDITYLYTDEGYLYLAVIDLWSRAVIGRHHHT